MEVKLGEHTIQIDEADRGYLDLAKWSVVKRNGVHRVEAQDKNRIIFLHRLISKAKDGEWAVFDNDNPLDLRRTNIKVLSDSKDRYKHMVSKHGQPPQVKKSVENTNPVQIDIDGKAITVDAADVKSIRKMGKLKFYTAHKGKTLVWVQSKNQPLHRLLAGAKSRNELVIFKNEDHTDYRRSNLQKLVGEELKAFRLKNSVIGRAIRTENHRKAMEAAKADNKATEAETAPTQPVQTVEPEIFYGGHQIFIDPEDKQLITEHKWSVRTDSKGHLHMYRQGDAKMLQQVILGAGRGERIAHLDGNTLNYRRANLENRSAKMRKIMEMVNTIKPESPAEQVETPKPMSVTTEVGGKDYNINLKLSNNAEEFVEKKAKVFGSREDFIQYLVLKEMAS